MIIAYNPEWYIQTPARNIYVTTSNVSLLYQHIIFQNTFVCSLHQSFEWVF